MDVANVTPSVDLWTRILHFEPVTLLGTRSHHVWPSGSSAI